MRQELSVLGFVRRTVKDEALQIVDEEDDDNALDAHDDEDLDDDGIQNEANPDTFSLLRGIELRDAVVSAEILDNSQIVHDAHTRIEKHHMHSLGRGSGRSHGGSGLLWLIVTIHIIFIAVWARIWWIQRNRKDPNLKREFKSIHCELDSYGSGDHTANNTKTRPARLGYRLDSRATPI